MEVESKSWNLGEYEIYIKKWLDVGGEADHRFMTVPAVKRQCPKMRLVAMILPDFNFMTDHVIYEAFQLLGNYRNCGSPNLICLRDWFIILKRSLPESVKDWIPYDCIKIYVLIFPWFDYTLDSYINNKELLILSEPKRGFSIICQLLLGLNEIHSQGFAHQHLSGTNVVINVRSRTKEVLVKIADLQRICRSDGTYKKMCTTNTLRKYRPPEWEDSYTIINTELAQKGDIWALGILILEKIFGTHITGKEDIEVVQKNIRDSFNNEKENINEYEFNVIDSALDMVSLLLQTDPNNRPTIKELITLFNPVDVPKPDLQIDFCSILSRDEQKIFGEIINTKNCDCFSDTINRILNEETVRSEQNGGSMLFFYYVLISMNDFFKEHTYTEIDAYLHSIETIFAKLRPHGLFLWGNTHQTEKAILSASWNVTEPLDIQDNYVIDALMTTIFRSYKDYFDQVSN